MLLHHSPTVGSDSFSDASTNSNTSHGTIKRWRICLLEKESADWNRDDPLRFELVAAGDTGCAEDGVVESNGRELYRLDTDLELRIAEEQQLTGNFVTDKERVDLSQTPWFGNIETEVGKKLGTMKRFVMLVVRITRRMLCV